MSDSAAVTEYYGWLSLLPSLIAIGMAMLSRQVFVALFLGVWSGAYLLSSGGFVGIYESFFRVMDTYLLQALAPKDGDSGHMSIVLFSLTAGGMVGVITRNGGMEGIVNYLSRMVKTRRGGQGVTAGLGCLIFFDDYSNTLIVGNTMRPLTDRLKISREKLAFLVDSTAAPMACIAVITTWFAFEASLINDALPESYAYVNGFELLMYAIPYNFYPIFMLAFVALSIITQRDFGAMYEAETKALEANDSEANQETYRGTEPLAINALLPILTLAGMTCVGLGITGEGETIREILGSADPIKALMWGALSALMVAIVLSVITKRLTISQTMGAMELGLQPMLLAVMVLSFAWAISNVNEDLKTADFIVSWIGNDLNVVWLPLIVFVVAMFTSFATGTSWGTMGILVPLVVPLVFALLGQASGLDDPATHPIVLAVIASVLGGAVWGDHCSPISDTTVLSSMASQCNLMAHVMTQVPYALVVAVVSIFIGIIPVSFGISWWLSLIIGIIVLYGVLRVFGKKA